MRQLAKALFFAVLICGAITSRAQCNQSISINSYSSSCNGSGVSTVTVNVTILFGNGNNSATLSYNLGAGEVYTVFIEDDAGDVVNQDFIVMIPSCTFASLTLTAWTNPSGGGSSCADPPPVVIQNVVPVEFGLLEVEERDDDVLLSWETFSEQNNSYFEVQRSNDNRVYTTIGKIEGEGTSASKKEYNYTDERPNEANNYYRIMQVDFDGTTNYSDVVQVRMTQGTGLMFYPNPATDIIYFESPMSGTLQIRNAVGGIERNEIISDAEQFDISNLTPGIYIIYLSDGQQLSRLIKL